MKKKMFLLLTLALFLAPHRSEASRKDYIFLQPNNPANYVKLEKLKKGEAEQMALSHPYTFTAEQMANILRSLVYSRQALFTDKVKSRQVFEEEYVEQYTPFLVEAFAKATPEQRVAMSVAQQRPLLIIRNDRLTQVRMWVAKDGLHVLFIKTEAKLLGDYQANTPGGQQLIDNAVGLRISLDPQPGQQFSFNSTQELILDPNADWAAVVAKIEEEEAAAEASKKQKKGKKAEVSDASAPAPPPPQPVAPPMSEKDQKSAESRLTELKKLRDKGLISEQDYNKKKEEILKNM
jgi:hypothetical protein